ncbi:MAG: response regulator transcription factor [Caldilineaceae bacterium]
MIKVLVADDHKLVRQGICTLLQKHGEIVISGEAANGAMAVAMVQDLMPDVAVLDIAMPQLDGIQALKQIVTLPVPTNVVILSMHDRPLIAQRALRAGAKGYLLKTASPEELWLAVEAASQGEIYLSPRISQSILDDFWSLEAQAGATTPNDLLTSRELEVLQLLAEGHTNKSIAHELKLSPKTVEKHRANIMQKLGVNELASLIRKAMQAGLIFA